MYQLKPIGINIPLVKVTQKNLFAYKLQDSFLFLWSLKEVFCQAVDCFANIFYTYWLRFWFVAFLH